MRMASFLMVVLVGSEVGCSSEDDVSPLTDAGLDQTTSDASLNDTGAKKDSGTDSGTDGTASDGTVDDGSMDADDGATDGSDDGSMDADDGASDSGDDGSDGSICPPCMMGYACCTLMKSFNYGKCYDPKCLACCM